MRSKWRDTRGIEMSFYDECPYDAEGDCVECGETMDCMGDYCRDCKRDRDEYYADLLMDEMREERYRND